LVTSYDNRTKPLAGIKQVVAAKEHFWYCWGEFHRNGGTPANATGFLGESHADLAQPDEARRIGPNIAKLPGLLRKP